MYAYIPSPFGGRLPSYALAKANKPEEPKADKPAEVEEPKPDPSEETRTENTSSDAPAPYKSRYHPDFDKDDDEIMDIASDYPRSRYPSYVEATRDHILRDKASGVEYPKGQKYLDENGPVLTVVRAPPGNSSTREKPQELPTKGLMGEGEYRGLTDSQAKEIERMARPESKEKWAERFRKDNLRELSYVNEYNMANGHQDQSEYINHLIYGTAYTPPAPPAQAPAPAPESPKPEAPKPAETKVGETGTEGAPPPEPAPVEANRGGKTPAKKRQSDLDFEPWKQAAPQFDWEKISEKYAHLPDGKKRQFDSQLRYARNGPRSALEWLARQYGDKVLDYSTFDDKAKVLDAIGERAASKALLDREKRIASLEAKGVDLDTYKGPVTPREEIRDKDDNKAEGITQIPLGELTFVDEKDENGNPTGRKIPVNKRSKSKASARWNELNKELMGPIDLAHLIETGEISRPGAKLRRGEADLMTEEFNYPNAANRKNITVLQTGAARERGKEKVNYIDPTKKDQVNKYAKPLVGVIYDKDGDPIHVRTAPVSSSDTLGVETEFFDDHGDVLDLDRLDEKGLAQFDAMVKDPDNIRTIWSGMPGERQVISYLENTHFKRAHFQGGEILDSGKYQGKMWDIGEDMRAGAVINPETKKAEAVFFKGDSTIPIRVSRGEDGQFIASTSNLTDEQKQAILNELDNFHPYRNGNGEVVDEPEQEAAWKELETVMPKKRQFYGGNITSRGTYRGYSEDIGADVRAGAYINPKTDEAEPVFLVGEGSNVPVKIARDEQGNITNPELTDEQKQVILDRINDFHPYRDLAGKPMEADEGPKPVERVPKGPLYRIDKKTNTIKLSRTNAERFGNARYSDDTVKIDGNYYYKVLDARGDVVGYHLAEDVPGKDKENAPGKGEENVLGKDKEEFPDEDEDDFLDEDEDEEETTESTSKSATMTVREMRMPSIADMIRDRRLRSAPYPSVTPLGRALP